MIRSLAVFVALFAGAAAVVSLLPTPAKVASPSSAVAAQLRNEADPVAPQPSVRVVYPAPGTSAAAASPLRSASVIMPDVPSPKPVAGPAVNPDPGAPGGGPVNVAVSPPAEALKASTQGLNLNTATIEALNQIPGAGHIGRTIASHRPYRSVEDLLAKRVVRKSVYDRIKDQVAAQ